MSELRTFDSGAFETEVLGSDRPVLVDFFAEWCPPCKAIAPVLEQIAGTHTDLTVGKVDVDADPDIAMRFGIMSLPTLGVFRGGKMVDRLVGYPGPASVRSWVTRAVETAPA